MKLTDHKTILEHAQSYLIQNYTSIEYSQTLFETLHRELPWSNFPTAHRKHCNMGHNYQFSGFDFKEEPMHPLVQEVINQINSDYDLQMNSCYANLYGPETTLGFHSDSEHQLDQSHPIISLSLGAPRNISFKYNVNQKETVIELIDGDLLIMHTDTQRLYQHAIKAATKQQRITSPGDRISLTFRKFK